MDACTCERRDGDLARLHDVRGQGTAAPRYLPQLVVDEPQIRHEGDARHEPSLCEPINPHRARRLLVEIKRQQAALVHTSVSRVVTGPFS